MEVEVLSFLRDYAPFVFGVAALAVTYVITPVIIDISHLKHLFDTPSGYRKVHKYATPNLGGVGIFATVLIVFSISGYSAHNWAPYLLFGLTILFFSGLKDDILVISPLKKLALQCTAIGALIFGGGVVMTQMGGIFGYYQIPYWAGVAFTFFTLIVIVNAYNLIDGIDGLAGGIGVITSLCFGTWFWWTGMMPEAVLAFVLAGSLLAFLWYNFEPASIFMGDTGSQVVGYLLGFLAVSFIRAGLSADAPVPFRETIPVVVLSILVIPLYDTLRVFLVRVVRGGSPFKADRLHVHHQLLDVGLSHKTICCILYAFNLAIIGMTLLLSGLDINLLFGVVLLTTFIIFPAIKVKRRLLQKTGIKFPPARLISILERETGFPSGPVRQEYSEEEETEEEEQELKKTDYVI